MKVRAKFYVQSVNHVHQPNPGQTCAVVKLAAVYGEENQDWSKYTPQGTVEMTITNPAAVEAFALGASYILEFTPVE